MSNEAQFCPANSILQILEGQSRLPQKEKGEAFAPANVALCKYWGKRDNQLNLPVTNSLSVSLGSYGARTILYPIDAPKDKIFLNGNELTNAHSSGEGTSSSNVCNVSGSGSDNTKHQRFTNRLISFLDLFRDNHNTAAIDKTHFHVETFTNIPVAAGLASSASGFAALVLALKDLYQWNIDVSMLSVLARLGSGSASRSLWQGFVEWERGDLITGIDSFAHLLKNDWYEFRVGLLIMNANEKPISSREAMKNTMATSEFYQCWPERVASDLRNIKKAIRNHDFDLLGETSESNALCMHALMQTARPPIIFNEEYTIAAQHKIWHLRNKGLRIYFTQDAGPNLKLLYLAEDEEKVKAAFPNILPIAPMQKNASHGFLPEYQGMIA